MTRVKQAFNNGKAFIPYITVGYPDLATTEHLVKVMAKAGADLIELGIPFSDPSAEGPVIQNASAHALKQGFTTDDIFDMVVRLRQEIDTPLVFMTYANLIYKYGTERFAKRSKEVGMDGIILPDVPFEEKEEFAPSFQEQGLDFISLISPSSKERIKMIAKEAQGFVYVVSSMGVTGTRSEITTDIGAMVDLVKEANPDIPAAVGFGISDIAQARAMGQHGDGIIIGSALIKLITEHGNQADQVIAQYVKDMRVAANELSY